MRNSISLKEQALLLRKRGSSLKDVEKKLGISRSTLSGWFKKVILSSSQKATLNKRWRQGLITARKKAVLWHNQQKELRVREAQKSAEETLAKIDYRNQSIIELALAMVYLGEGAKSATTSIGNADPIILEFFVRSMEKVYSFPREKIKCSLNLRFDQDPIAMKKFWSKRLKIPLSNFGYVSIDKRTLNKPTFDYYKGVCHLNFGNIAFQRKLIYLSKQFADRIIRE